VDGRHGDHVLLAPPYVATSDDIDRSSKARLSSRPRTEKLLVNREEQMKRIIIATGLLGCMAFGGNRRNTGHGQAARTLVCGVSAGLPDSLFRTPRAITRDSTSTLSRTGSGGSRRRGQGTLTSRSQRKTGSPRCQSGEIDVLYRQFDADLSARSDPWPAAGAG